MAATDGTICMYSVEYGSKRIFAIVPDGSWKALERLREDDPIWQRGKVQFHWAHSIARDAHVKLRDRITFVHS